MGGGSDQRFGKPSAKVRQRFWTNEAKRGVEGNGTNLRGGATDPNRKKIDILVPPEGMLVFQKKNKNLFPTPHFTLAQSASERELFQVLTQNGPILDHFWDPNRENPGKS